MQHNDEAAYMQTAHPDTKTNSQLLASLLRLGRRAHVGVMRAEDCNGVRKSGVVENVIGNIPVGVGGDDLGALEARCVQARAQSLEVTTRVRSTIQGR